MEVHTLELFIRDGELDLQSYIEFLFLLTQQQTEPALIH